VTRTFRSGSTLAVQPAAPVRGVDDQLPDGLVDLVILAARGLGCRGIDLYHRTHLAWFDRRRPAPPRP
jgi:hypothetical protein